jgi:predicted amidohydrolase
MTPQENALKMLSKWHRPLKVAVVQTKLHLGDIDSNLKSAIELLNELRDMSTDIVVLPEVFATGFDYEKLPDLVKRSDEVVSRMSDSAKSLNSHLIFTQVVEEGGSFFNRLFHLDRNGDVRDTYDKTHLFSRAGEDRFFTPGNHLITFNVDDTIIGPLICYEVRFPEISRKLVLEGAGILIYPAQWPQFRTFQWDTLLRARAIENQCYVVGVNVHGDHGGSMMGGMSEIYSAYGDLLCRVEKNEGWAVAELDPLVMGSIREKIPVLTERRQDLRGP